MKNKYNNIFIIYIILTIFILDTSKQVLLANSGDPKEMLHKGAFHQDQGLH